MTFEISVRYGLSTALVLVLAACGGPAQETLPQASPSQPQDAARADSAADQEALRAPSRPEGETRQAREAGDVAPAPADDGERMGFAPGAAAGGFAEGHPVPDEVRPLLGEWVVSGHHVGAVAALDDASALRLHGRELAYGEAHANSGADSCGVPRYSARQRNVVEILLVDYRTSPMALGLDQATDAQVTVIDVECAQPWVTLGSRVLVLPNGVVLAPWDGVFFELQPR